MSKIEPIIVNGGCFFGADCHFGAPNFAKSAERESLFIEFLDEISDKVEHLFLLGDIFDFWFEYNKQPMPEYLRLIEKLKAMRQNGVNIYFFTGNHDMWARDYFPSLGITIFREPTFFQINGKLALLGHGDGLGSNSKGYAFIKWLFSRRWSAFLYACIPAVWGKKLALACSKSSRKHGGDNIIKTFDEKKEHLIKYCHQQNELNHDVELFIFGHRHLVLQYPIKNATYFNVGDWLVYNSYLEFMPGDAPRLRFYRFSAR